MRSAKQTSTKQSSSKKTSAKKKDKKPKTPRQSITVKPADCSLREWQCTLRRQIAQREKFVVEPARTLFPQGYYSVRKPIYARVTLKTLENENTRLLGYGTPYNVVYRGDASKWNYCSCMDFKTSGLGTCKHIEAVKLWIERNGRRVARKLPTESSVYLDYSDGRKIKIRIGSNDREVITEVARDYFDSDGTFIHADFALLYKFLDQVYQVSDSCRCYKDVYEHINEYMRHRELESLSQGVNNGLIQSLIKVQLFKYQLEGVKFAFRHGRSIIADEMGLGKTIQAIATAELMRYFKLATSVLVVCPTSLKYQWKHEIEKFTGSSAVVIEGSALKRREIYELDNSYYKIISYNALANDVKSHGSIHADLLVMDEVQRLKNWDTQIAKAARKVTSSYTLLLSGTPLENKLEELYSIVELVDQYALSPYYQFRDKYIVTDSAGMTIGYNNLNEISQRLSNILIRRRKSEVALQMPSRMDKTLYVPMTKKQQIIHGELEYKVSIIVHKWRKYHFLSEHDRLRLMMLLGQMRMVASSTFILDQHSRDDNKIEELCNILRDIFSSGDEKVVIFSGWERMTRLIAAELDKMGVKYSNLNGSVPSVKRKRLVEDFTNDKECRVFLSTDAGATGLNLQAGSIIINMELPWNPAVHEQRIGRIYRLGQQRNIQVINMVSIDSIEQDIETKLQFKSAVAEGILDNGDDSVFLPKKKFDEIIETLDKIMEKKEEAAKNADATPIEPDATDNANEVEPLATSSAEPQSEPQLVPSDDGEDIVDESADEAESAHPDAHSVAPATAADSNTESATEAEGTATAAAETAEPVAATSASGTTHPDNSTSAASSGTSVSSTAKAVDIDHSTTRNTNGGASSASTPAADLVTQGITFLSGLAETLKSPERTRELVDQIVKTDEQTGQTTIQIPVSDKQIVTNILSVFSALLHK